MTELNFNKIDMSLIININIIKLLIQKLDFKENVTNFFSILALLRGPTVWPSRARFGPRATN